MSDIDEKLAKLNKRAAKFGMQFRRAPDRTRTGIGEDFRQIAADLGIEVPEAKNEDGEKPMGGIGSGGNRRSPRELKILQGTHRPDREKTQKVKPSKRKPRKPAEIKADKVASQHWDMIVKTRADWISDGDTAALQTVCETWSLQRRMKSLFEEDMTNFRLRASYNALTELWAKQAAKFGLDPRSREALGTCERADPTQAELAQKYLS